MSRRSKPCSPGEPGTNLRALILIRAARDDMGGLVGVSLSKGGNVSLTKEAPNLTAVIVGLGWDARTTTGSDFDLDASALLTSEQGKVLSDQHFVFFNNLRSPDG